MLSSAYDQVAAFAADGESQNARRFETWPQAMELALQLIGKQRTNGLTPDEALDLSDCFLHLEFLMRLAKSRAFTFCSESDVELLAPDVRYPPATCGFDNPRLAMRPRISSFYGIAIYMYHRDHAPSHFHAIYGDDEAEIDIITGEIAAGHLPRRASSLVSEWTELHRTELQANWGLARRGRPLRGIDPLN